MNIHIIGCGTIGSMLAIRLYENHMLDSLTLYDRDIVRRPISHIYDNSTISLFKVEVLRDYIITHEKPNNTINIPINIHSRNITNIKSDKNNIYIDCRDSNSKLLNSDLKIGYDNNLLVINCKRDDSIKFTSVTEYIQCYDKCKLDMVISILIRFINDKMYKDDAIFLYNINDLLNLYKRVT